MNILQITPGAGRMYCGNCFRDNAMVAALRDAGHAVTMLPLYLPLTLDETDQSAGMPIFYNGVNVYLEQRLPLYRQAPRWVHRMIGSRRVLDWAAGRAAKTRAEDVGDLTLSMLRGEEGNQACELEEMLAWLRTQPQPDVICLSNALLLGMARRLRAELRAPIVCLMQNEGPYIDQMPNGVRDQVWALMAERARDVACFVAPSRYYAQRMQQRLNLSSDRVHAVYNGINTDGYTSADAPLDPPVLGFFSRMCRDKGLDTLVEAFVQLRQRNRVPRLKLRVGGGCGPSDEPFVEGLRQNLHAHGLLGDVDFQRNLDRAGKQRFLKSLSVLSVPAAFGEAFGFYVIEALAAGVPVVQPRTASFPELVEATGGGVCYEPTDVPALVDAIEKMLLAPAEAKAMGLCGRDVVLKQFSHTTMARSMAELFAKVSAQPHPA